MVKTCQHHFHRPPPGRWKTAGTMHKGVARFYYGLILPRRARLGKHSPHAEHRLGETSGMR
jgi:hypothetical protein